MRSPFSVALPNQLQRRGEIIGVICGAFCFPFAFFGESLGRLFPDGPAGIILPIVLFSAMAGIIACLFGTRKEAEEMAGFAPRVGVRAGLVATLVGGALTVFAASLHSMEIGSPSPNSIAANISSLVLPSSRPRQILVIALMGIPPSVFFGMAGALITAMVRTQPLGSSEGFGEHSRTPGKRSILFMVVLLFSSIGYLSPFLLLFKPRAKSLPPVVTTSPLLTPIPKWRYQKPADFDTAEASRIVVIDQMTIEDIDEEQPIAISPDGLRLAYSQSGGNNLTIRDLVTNEITTSLEIQPTSLAWEFTSKRLLIVTNTGERKLHVLDERNRLLDLPQPAEARIPDGRVVWWGAEEVSFVERTGFDKKMKVLNLDVLRIQPSEDFQKWNSLPAKQKRELWNGPDYFAENAHWKMGLHKMVTRYYVPPNPAIDWTSVESLQIGFESVLKAETIMHAATNVSEGDHLLSASDGTKLIRLRKNDGTTSATVFYFGTRPPSLTSFQVSMPGEPDSSLAEALTKKTVCGFVCSPLINPLNGRTVGPNREQIKAIVRIASWKDGQAEFWADESYQPIQPGDVVADLHTWNNQVPKAAGRLGLSEWFAVIEKPASSPAIPERAILPSLGRIFSTIYLNKHGSTILKKVRGLFPEENPQSPPTPVTTGTRTPQSVEPNAEGDINKTLTDFIRQHHAKSSRGDLDGLVNNYAEKVDHFDHGLVDRERIYKEELEYHAPGVTVEESIVGAVKINELGGDSHQANYTIAYKRTLPDGRWNKGFSDITLKVARTTEGWRIFYQRAAARDQQKGP